MDDKTVFQGQTSGSSSSAFADNQPITPIQEPNPMQESSVQQSSIPQENSFSAPEREVFAPSTAPLPPPPSSSFLSLGNIVKIIIGIGVVAIFLFLVLKVVPGFFNNSTSQVTLTYWGVWEDAPTMNSIITDFEKINPNIKVNYSKQDIKQYRETLSARIGNGTGPDIFHFHNTWLPMFKSSLLPMSQDVITNQDFSKSFYPVTQGDLVSNGAIYGIPAEIDTLALYVNTQLLQAAGISAPSNWQDFITDSRQLTVKDQSGKIQTAGAALGSFGNINHAPDIVSLLLVQNQASLSNLSSTKKQATDALTFYTSFATGNGNVWDSTQDSSIVSFAKGSLAMYFGYSWDYFAIKAANPSLVFDIVPVPHLPGQNQTIASYWADGVSAKSKHQKEALLFMKYLAQKTTEQALYTVESKTRFFGEPYARVDLAQSLKDNPVVSPFVSQAPNAVSTFFSSDTYDNALNSQMNTYLGNAVNSILNGTSPDSAVDTLSSGVSQVLTQYGK